jgi:two-component system response regulator YesN
LYFIFLAVCYNLLRIIVFIYTAKQVIIMYKLIVVDDEANIREEIGKFSWNHLNIEVDSLCDNGLTALKKASESLVDIVLTDIRMPIMNGLELIKFLKRDFPYIHIVALSGYSDFDYLRTCLRSNIDDYLLKPINKDEFEETFKNIVKKLDQNRQHELKREIGEKKARFAIKFYRREFLKKILSESLTDEEIEEGSAYGEVTLFSGCFSVIKFRLDNLEQKRKLYSLEEWKLIIFALDKKLEDFCDETELGYSWLNPDTAECFIIITSEEIQKDNKKLAKACLDLKEVIYSIKGLIKTTVSCGVGLRQHSANNIYKSAAQASIALNSDHKDNDIIFFNSDLESVRENRKSAHESEGSPFRNTENYPQITGSQKHIIDHAIKYINENFNRSITLADVANHVYINRVYLSSIFKEVVGVNFIDYLTSCRIEMAKKLLSDPRYKIYQISEAIGYENPRYFSNVFKKYTGKTPYEYRSIC